MPDHRFFKRGEPLSLGRIAEISGAEIRGPAAPDFLIHDVAPLDKAGPEDLSFLDNAKYKADFLGTRAGACFVDPDVAESLSSPQGLTLLLTRFPYKAYALTAQTLYPDSLPDEGAESRISPRAIVDETAQIGAGSIVAAGAVVCAGARIGPRCRIEENAVIGENVQIGMGCRIGVGASVSHALIGDYVRLYPGVRVGQDGFGFAIDPSGHVKVPQLGRVLIEDHVEIGANTTIDRGSGPDTVIGQGTWIDNLVQIGHNVRVGKGCVIVSQAGVSGSTVLEDYAVLAGQAGIAGHLRIGMGARIGAKAGVMRDVPAGESQLGSPAVPAKQYMREIAALRKLAEGTRGGRGKG